MELSEIWVNDDGKAFSLIVTMPDTAGNEYQGGKVSFDLRVGFPGDANSSVIISSSTTASTTVSTVSTVLPVSALSGRSPVSVVWVNPSRRHQLFPPTRAVNQDNSSNQNDQGKIAGVIKENKFLRDILKIILGLLTAGAIILAFTLRKFFPPSAVAIYGVPSSPAPILNVINRGLWYLPYGLISGSRHRLFLFCQKGLSFQVNNVRPSGCLNVFIIIW